MFELHIWVEALGKSTEEKKRKGEEIRKRVEAVLADDFVPIRRRERSAIWACRKMPLIVSIYEGFFSIRGYFTNSKEYSSLFEKVVEILEQVKDLAEVTRFYIEIAVVAYQAP